MSHPYWHDALLSSSATVTQHRRANAIARDGASRKRISRDPAHFHLPQLPPRKMADDSFVSFVFNESSNSVARRTSNTLCLRIDVE